MIYRDKYFWRMDYKCWTPAFAEITLMTLEESQIPENDTQELDFMY